MLDMLKRAWSWIMDRLSERSTKTFIFNLLGLLAAIGFISLATVEEIKALIEAGQEAYFSIATLVAGIITNVKGILGILSGFIALFAGLFGAISPDAKSGKTYDMILRENDVDPDIAYEISLSPRYRDERKHLLRRTSFDLE